MTEEIVPGSDAVKSAHEPDADFGRAPSGAIPLLAALVPVIALVGFLSVSILILPRHVEGFEGTGHLPLVLAAAVGAVVARAYGYRWSDMESGIVDAIRMAMGAMLILLVIGMLIGTWLAAGVVPALIDWGLELLSPAYFLPATCAVCSIVSLVTGSSWSTAGTVGLALVGIGSAMGIDPAMTAGAVVSGAYFGDKLSPLSDTTNLAPAMAGTDLFTHIRHMVWTTGPAWVLAMIGYGVLSLGLEPSHSTDELAAIQATITRNFDPGFVHLLPPLVVVVLVMRRQPALPSLFLGVVLGGFVALGQGLGVADVLTAASTGFVSHTGNASVDDLLSRGGMMSMASTVLLIMCAMSFGGVMERTGMLGVLAARVLATVKSTASLIATTVLTAFGTNVITADQYISIVVPGRMFADEYRARGLHPKNLSRALEDGGTITSALLPWNTCGAFMTGTLLFAVDDKTAFGFLAAYAPYAFLNVLNPLLSIVYGITGFTIERAPAEAPKGAA